MALTETITPELVEFLMVPDAEEGPTVEELLQRPRWQAEAACADWPVEIFFPKAGPVPAKASAICAGCPVRAECLAYALADQELEGIWAGTSQRQRRRMRPKVDRETGCGTRAGAERHRRLGEPECDPCRAARLAYKQAWRSSHRS